MKYMKRKHQKSFYQGQMLFKMGLSRVRKKRIGEWFHFSFLTTLCVPSALGDDTTHPFVHQ